MQEISPDFEQAWQRFRALDALRLVDDTLESQWAHGRRDYLAFLVPLDDPAVQAHVARMIEAIHEIRGVEAYPPSYWHITIKGVGFLVDRPSADDEVSPADTERIIRDARGVFEREPAFEVQIGRANGFPEVVFLEVCDGGRVRSLNTRLLEEVPGLSAYPIDGPVFLPHISIARFTSSEGRAQVQAALAELREGPPGPAFVVREVQLIQAHLSQTAPTFDLLASYRLAG